MLYQLHAFTSAGVTGAGGAAWAGAVVFVVGVLLWLAGSRVRQMLVTLTTVGGGAGGGEVLPGGGGWGSGRGWGAGGWGGGGGGVGRMWRGWVGSAIDRIGPCFGGARVLGLLGSL